MVADAIEGFETEVERLENDIGTPNGMVIATGDEGIEGVFACMAPWAVPAVVSEGYGLGEGDIEPQRPRDGCGHLCDLEGAQDACISCAERALQFDPRNVQAMQVDTSGEGVICSSNS
jgi:hypothetical protein